MVIYGQAIQEWITMEKATLLWVKSEETENKLETHEEAKERQDIRNDLEDKKIKAAIRQRKSTCTTRRNHRW